MISYSFLSVSSESLLFKSEFRNRWQFNIFCRSYGTRFFR
jgi:hypothetical protein